MTEPTIGDQQYLHTLLVTAGVIGIVAALAALTVYVAHDVLLVLFAGVLLAVLLDALARLLHRYLPIGHLASLGLGIIGVSLLIGVFVATAGPQVSEQLTQLVGRLPEAIAQLKGLLEEQTWGRTLLRSAPSPAALVPSAGDMLGEISGVFSSAVGTLVNVVIVLVMGLYIAVNPTLYVHGFLLLIPPGPRPRAEQVLTTLGRALRWWLIGRIASMTVVGILTSVGLWLIQMPLVLALGLTAGVLAFIPLVGPILSAVPAVLLGLVEDPLKALNVLLVYAAVQFLEGNFITPLIQKRAIDLPPAVLLTGQLLMGVLFGFFGLLLATPLAVTLIVLVQMLYVQDLLDSPVRVLGEHKAH
jgi:predicted PurR-regulated permease PerM